MLKWPRATLCRGGALVWGVEPGSSLLSPTPTLVPPTRTNASLAPTATRTPTRTNTPSAPTYGDVDADEHAAGRWGVCGGLCGSERLGERGDGERDDTE